jgi:hypothetical protein
VNTERDDGDVHGAFDLIIGSDLLYERDAGGLLAAFIGRHASPAGEVWIVDPDRGKPPRLQPADGRTRASACARSGSTSCASVSQRGVPGAIADLPARCWLSLRRRGRIPAPRRPSRTFTFTKSTP